MNKTRILRLYSLVIVLLLLISPLSALFPWNQISLPAKGEGILDPISTITDTEPENNFGWNVSWAGDVNDDGYDDIIAGAPNALGGIYGGDWWNSNWASRKKLTFNNIAQSEDLMNFPVLVNLSAFNFIYSKANSDGTDLRFIDADDTTELNYHIEKWDSSGYSLVWVNVSQIDGSSSTDYIWMYYNNSGASDIRDVEGTYDGNFSGVWHLNETSSTHYDATSNNNDGSPQGGVNQDYTGKIDGADDFDGDADYIDCGTSSSLNITNQITLEAWVRPDGIDRPDGHLSVIDKYDTSDRAYALSISDDAGDVDDLDFRLSSDGITTDGDLHISNAADNNAWQYIAGTWDGTDMRFYKNGVEIGTSVSFSGPIYQSTTNLWIGDGTYLGSMGGIIDEVRISNKGRSADWIKAQYLSMNNSFLSYGAEEIKLWWDSSWSYRQKLTFDNAGQSENLVNFPVLVNLSASNFDYLKTKLDGTDLRFIDADNVTELNYEIEFWNSSGNSYIWVNVTRIDAGSLTDYIWMYYGNSVASDGQNKSGTFDSSYIGVWHLNEIGDGTADEFKDSTFYGNDGQGGSGTPGYVPIRIDGKIGGGQEFDGLDDHINNGYDTSLDIGSTQITLEAWINFAGYNPSNYMGIISHDGWDQGYRLVIRENGDPLYFHLPEDADWLGASQDTPIDSWVHVVGVYDGSNMMIYLNGVKDSNELSKTDNIETTPNEFWIGHGDNVVGEIYSYPWNGSIDEIRVSNIARSADWIKAQHLSMNDTFITYGSEETRDWWNSDWSYRKKLTFDNSGQTEDLLNFPVLVNLSASNFDYLKAKLDGTDLRFIDEDGVTDLNYEIESWNYSGNSFIWVNVTNIAAGSSTDYIWMYYGNFNANDGSNPVGVWDSNYVGVWHLKEDPGPGNPGDIKDSTINYNNGTAEVSMTSTDLVTGKIDGSIDFDGSDDYVSKGDDIVLDLGAEGTISVWFKRGTVTDWDCLVAKGDANNRRSHNYALMIPSGSDMRFHVGNGASYDEIFIGAPYITDTTSFHHAVGVWDGTWLYIYLDGAERNKESQDISPAGNAAPLFIGQYGGNVDRFNGIIDEVRISNVDRSPDWVKAQYLSMTYDFISFSNEESLSDSEGFGKAYIFLGYPGIGLTDIYTSSADVTISGENSGDQFGWSVGAAGDVNSDGIDDVIIGAPGWNADTGRAYIFYGRTSWNQSYSASEADVILTGENPGDRFGSSLAGIKYTEAQIGFKDWLYRKKITINSSQVVEDLYDFPVLINITDFDLRDRARSDGYDIFFTELDGTTKLEHEMESYNGTSGELVAWVKIPSLSSSSDKTIYMYYGNLGRNEPMENPAAVWDANYSAVWHLNDDLLDSTSNGYHGTNFGSEDIRSLIANGQDFENDDSTDKIDVGNWNIEGQGLTIQAWVNFESFASDGRIISKAEGNSDDDHTWMLSERNDTIRLRVRTNSTIALEATGGGLSSTPWYFAVGTYDGTNMRLRLDKTEVGSAAQTGNIQQDVRGIAIGNQPQGTLNPFDGIIDELRVSSIRRSDAWLDTEFNNQVNPSSFYSCGLEEINAISWEYRKPITIDSDKVAGDLIDFPLLINLTDLDLKNRARLEGNDIVFTMADGKIKLDHEIEGYNSSLGELIAWVRIPSLSSSSDTIIYMYYGNNRCSVPTEIPTGVWKNGYKGVWHLSEASGDAQDSTSYGTDGTIGGTVTQGDTGKIDGAYTIEPNGDDNIDMGDPVDGHLDFGTGSFTVSVWIKDYPYTNYNNIIYKGARSGSDTLGYSLYHRSNDGDACWAIGDTVARVQNDYDYSQDGTWRHLVGVADRDSQESRIYVNGVEQGTGVSISSIGSVDSDRNFEIPSSSSYLDATVDEVRVSTGARSVEWILTEFNNQNDTCTFYSIGDEEIIPINWLYRKPITINSSKVTGNLTDYPMLISIVDSDLKEKAQGNGYDIVFTEKNGKTKLDHEIESYDLTTGELTAWVRIPNLSSIEDTIIYLHYGNSDSTNWQNPEGVWDDNYQMVQHLQETFGAHYDSTQYDNDGTEYIDSPGTQEATGKIDGADILDGSNDYVQISDSLSLDISSNITIEMWLNPDTLNDRVLLYKYEAYAMEIWFDGSFGGVIFRPAGGTETVGSGIDTMATGTWNHIVFSYNKTSQNMLLYLNSNEVGSRSYSGDIRISGSDLFICSDDTPTNFFDGAIDNLRISTVARSAAWISASYNNQNDTGSFYTVGAEESFPQNWMFRKAITVNISKITGDLTNFPVLVNTIDLDLKNKARPDGYDIVFSEEDGRTRLDFEIENYNSTSGELVAWVKVPFISATNPTIIYMHYGNSNQVSPTENPKDVWDEDYHSVWHLGEFVDGTNYEYNDSTSNNYDGEGGSGVPWRIPTQTNSKIGYGQNFDGNNDKINFSSMNPISYNDFTFEAWYKSTNLIIGTDQYIFAHMENGNNGPGSVFSITNDSGTEGYFRVTTRNSTQVYDAYYGTSDVHDQKYHHLVGVRENGLIKLYVDGKLENTLIDNHPGEIINVNAQNTPIVGDFPSQSEEVNGTLDEIRVSQVARSWDWINASFSNQNDTSTFYSIGPEEINPECWLYRKPITINSLQVSGNLTDFPYLIKITDSDLKDKARTDEYDIVFTDSNGRTKLDFEIERYIGNSGELIAWVRIPRLSSTTDKKIYMYYGSSDATDKQNIEGVWRNGYVGVYHMVEEMGDINNSASSTNDGTRENTPTQDTGQIGYGQNFTGSGTDDMFNVGDLGIADGTNEEITFSVWANIDNTSTENWGKIICKSNSSGTDYVYAISFDASADKEVYPVINGNSGNYNVVYKNTWLYLVGTYNGSIKLIYINGTLEGSKDQTGALWASSANTTIGAKETQVQNFGGILDEVRFSNVTRSPEWIETEYNNQNNPGIFSTLGLEELIGGNVSNNIVIGAFGYDNNRGRAYVFNGDSGLSGEILASSADVIINGSSQGDLFGWDVSGAGDVNNDRAADLIIGAPGNNSKTGTAYIFYDLDSLPSSLDSSNADVILLGQGAGDEFGFSVSDTQDLNNDGFDDIIVGAPFVDNGGIEKGSAYIYYGNDTMDSTPDVILEGQNDSDLFGFSVGSGNDINGNGIPEIIVGAPFYDNGPLSDTGAIYVFSGGPAMDNNSDWICKGIQTGEHFGWSVSSSENLDGTGSPYLIVGAPNNNYGGLNAGKIYLLGLIEDRPIISNILATPGIEFINNYINLTCSVTATNGISSVFVNITIPGGGFMNVSMDSGMGDQFYYYDNYSLPGIYQYTIWAIDSLGNITQSSIYLFEMLSASPLLSLAQANPVNGYITIDFNFTVQYTHPLDLPPDAFTLNITGPSHAGSWNMAEVDPGDLDYTDGKLYYYNYTGFTTGSYSFHFAANDSNGIWVETGVLPFDVLDDSPILSSQQVGPTSGYINTDFNFTMIYTSPIGSPPSNITVNITGLGVYDLVEVDPLDLDYTDGKAYYLNTSGFPVGNHPFHFAANDSIGNWIEGGTLFFDVLDSTPLLSLDSVNPPTGYPITGFNFTVTYTSPNNLAPDNILVNISGWGSYDLIPIDSLDLDYTDGNGYYINLSGFTFGTHPFHFAANDSNGIWVETVSSSFDILSSAISLTLPSVNPAIGYVDSRFNFTINYRSPANLPPVNINVTISSFGTFPLLEVDPLDTDYTDGKGYYFNTSGFTIRTYQFYFEANDSIGNSDTSETNQFNILNRPPTFSLPNVAPNSGNISSGFNFSVMYHDLDNQAPNKITVNITGYGFYDLLEVDPLDTDYTDGKEYYYNASGFTIGSFTFNFAANDTQGDWVETGLLGFNVLNRAPILSVPLVTPTLGYLASDFNFSVIYTDLDNHEPGRITVNISGVGIYDLIEVNPLDTNYFDGKQYYLNTSGFSLGSYTFHFAANDSVGYWVETGIQGFDIINQVPTLTAPIVNPNLGYLASDFNFTVIYIDLDDQAPGRITVNISGLGVYDLIESDSLDVDYTDGKEYYLNTTGFSLGSYTFHFAANDSVGYWVETGISGFDVINQVPTLSLPLVNPILGYLATDYNFTVIYTDLDDQAPGRITVNISGLGVYDLIESNSLDLDYTDGKLYYLNTTGFSLGSYTFHFAANDSMGYWVETGIFGFDVINRPPTLSSPFVNPIIGYLGSSFNFTIIYTDLDNQGPSSILVNITGLGSFPLIQSDPLDMDYTDGKSYYYNTSGIPLGLYSFNFAAYDPPGDWVESIILQFDVINRVPTLSFGGVNPTTGYFNSSYNFTVTYLDPDGDPPQVVVVNISGVGSYIMYEADPLDLDFSDGKLYFYNISGLPVGSHSFHFAANDSGGLWANETPEITGPDVLPINGFITIIDFTQEFTDDFLITATLLDNDYQPISQENITIYIDLNQNGIYESWELIGYNLTQANGNILINFITNIVPRTYNYTAIYNGSVNFSIQNDEAEITIIPKPASLLAIGADVESGYIVDLSALLIDVGSNRIENEIVAFYIDMNQNSIFDVSELISQGTTNSVGVAGVSYLVDLIPGDYSIRAKYVGSGNYSVNEIDGVLSVHNSTDRAPMILWPVPHQAKTEDSPPWTLDLTPYEVDVEDSGSDLNWYLTGIDTTLYTVTGMNSSNDVFTFIPQKDAYGNDETALWLVDSSGNRVSQILWINITPLNDPPFFNPKPPNLFVHFDDPADATDDPTPWDYTFYVHDTETPIDNLILTTSEPTVDGGWGYAEVNGLTVTFHYPEDRVGESILVTLTISDGIDTASTAILVNVTTDWIPELIAKLPNVVLQENTTLYNVFDLDDHFTDKDQNSLYFTSGFFHIQVTINENNTVDITSSGDWTGTEYVTFRAMDPLGAIVEDTILVTVIPVNDGPEISGVPDLVVHFDYSYLFDLTPYIFDPDNETMELQISSSELTDYIWVQPGNNLGIVVNYPEQFNGMTIPVTISVTDGFEWASQQIQITVTDDFPPELITKLPDVFFSEDAQIINAFRLSDYFFDFDGDALFYTTGNNFINVTINSNLTVDFSAPENWFGSEILTFRATDPHGALAEDKIIVVVVPVNDAPQIENIPKQEMNKVKQWTFDISGYIDDVDNEIIELIISVNSEAGEGFVRLVGNVLVFDYPKDIYEDIVTITVSDGELETSKSFIVAIERPEPAQPSIWDIIPWTWIMAFIIITLLTVFLFFRRHNRYWVYEVFLIHDKGLPLAHASYQESSDLEEVVVSGMFTAVQDFISDAFSGKTNDDDWELDEMKFGENKILIERQENLFLAVIFEGNGDKLRTRVKKLLEEINCEFSAVLEDWDGDMSKLKGLRAMTMKILPKKPKKRARKKKIKPEPQIDEKSKDIMKNPHDRDTSQVPENVELLEGAIETVEALVSDLEERGIPIGSPILEESVTSEVVEVVEERECVVCGASYSSSEESCPRCGTEFGKLKQMFDELQIEIIKCPSCGTTLEKGITICTVCGYDSQGAMRKIASFECPECSQNVEQHARFCSHCGVEFVK